MHGVLSSSSSPLPLWHNEWCKCYEWLQCYQRDTAWVSLDECCNSAEQNRGTTNGTATRKTHLC